jgi:hypothetical protein
MFERLPVLFRSGMYALRRGFLIRPLVITLILGTAGAVLSSLEESNPEISAWIANTLFPSRKHPSVAQVIPQQHRGLHYDGRVDRVCSPSDDAHACIDTILAAHPDQFR